MMEDRESSRLRQAIEAWKRETLARRAAPGPEAKPESKPEFATTSGIPVNGTHFPAESADQTYLDSLGFPGQFPFTRGIYPNMYRGRPWTIRQYAGYGTCEETNQRFKYLLTRGQTGLSVAFDLPTQMGYDSDNPIAEGEVGRAGVAIDSVEDMARLFDGIPLEKVSTSMTINATAPVILAMFIVVAETRGIKREALAGTVQNDILKEYIARGTYIFPPEPSLKLATDIFSFCGREMPSWNTISVSGYHMREAGATAVQEVAFTFADAITYVKYAMDAGLGVDQFAPRISFFFGAHNNFLEEVAKFRAARKMWAEIMKERFAARDPRSWMLRFHTQTCGSTLTAQQPLNNVVRVTLQALAAVLGGTQSLHTNSFDEALALPTEQAVRLALRTQQIIAHESGVVDTVDPLGGAYFVEYLTEEIEKRAKAYIEQIEAMGGVVRAIETGFIKQEIEKSAYTYQRSLETKGAVVVGLNEFLGEDTRPQTLKIDVAVEADQKARLQSLRKGRSSAIVGDCLRSVESAARAGENLLYPIIDAVKNRVTLGEICDVLKEVYGTFEEAGGR
jgi:methylmalonyl-CoA mutase N-terminal domain/subunit